MILPFIKMQGIGNDYVYINGFENQVENPSELAVMVSDRHYGIGSDGLILLLPSSAADLRMQMFNADGSEGKMCGNGIRCAGKLAFDLGICRMESMMIETLSGVKSVKLIFEDGEVTGANVDMGPPELESKKIPVLFEGARMVGQPLNVGDLTCHITCVSMGNPHVVVFAREIDSLDLTKFGPLFEKHKIFPEGVNTEFIQPVDEHTLRMRVWERGSGETLACGTGACAAVVAACLNGYCKRGEEILVHLRGGDLVIQWTNDSVWMKGPAQTVFVGEIDIKKQDTSINK